MTGKGLHSRGNRSVLKPTVVDWCRQKGFDFDEEEDNVRVYLTIN
jgi:DNA-nicking Smr family endonuclease